MSEPTEFSLFLKRARGTRTKAAVEEATHVHRASIRRAENDERLVSIKTLRALCDFYAVDAALAVRLMGEARAARDMRKVKEHA